MEVLAGDAPVFIEAGEDDAAGARAGVSHLQGLGGEFEISNAQLAFVFLRFQFALLAQDFAHLGQGFVHGIKGGVHLLDRGRFFHEGGSFRECGKRRNEKVFLLGDWNEGVRLASPGYGET